VKVTRPHNAVVKCEIKLFQNYFSRRRRPSEMLFHIQPQFKTQTKIVL